MHPFISRWLTLSAAASFAFSLGCAPKSFTVGGQVTGLDGELALSLNGTKTLNLTNNGAYKFATGFAAGASYNVAVATQPSGQNCTVTNGSGQIAAANVNNVNISCATTDAAPVITHIWPDSIIGGYEVKISGSNLSLASVAFNGAAIEPTLQTDNELRFIAPQNPAGTYALELENIAGVTSENVAQGAALAPAVDISNGISHSCAVLGGGEVRCWGYNTMGALGDGTTVDSITPVAVTNINNAVSVTVDMSHSCALLNTGAVKCWGSNSRGQLGDGSIIDRSTPVTVNTINNAVAVSAGWDHTCALLNTGAVKCWGGDATAPVTVAGIGNAVSLSSGSSHSCAALSTGTVTCWNADNLTTTPIPSVVANLSGVASITSGVSHDCALLNTGAIKCWGDGRYGSLGNGGTTSSTTPVNVTGISDAVAVSAGAWHSCAILTSGSVKCWGMNRYGELGDGNGGYPGAHSAVPVAVLGLSNATAVSTGSNSCVITSAGAIKCWGPNDSELQLGFGNTSVGSPTPVTIANLENAVAIEAAARHNCVLTNDGIVKCWGSADHDQLGNGSGTSTGIDGGRGSITPEVVTDLGSSAVSISAGWSHTCALLDTGAVKCWGNNDYGMLSGTSQSWSSAIPLTVTGVSNVASVSAGGDHSCARLNTGSVQCWGSNGFGQLGNGTTARRSEGVVTVIGLTDAISVSAGSSHTCAIRTSGAVQCWGNNYDGELGNGSFATVPPYGISHPVTVVGINNAVAVSAGVSHNCALLGDGTVKCWGDNQFGGLGNGTNVDSAIPVSVIGINNAVSISTAISNNSSCAVLNTGDVVCWGVNDNGQLGNGTTTSSNIPVPVLGISNAISVNVGAWHSCALLATGAVQCWGTNERGVLSLPSRYLPSPALPIYLP